MRFLSFLRPLIAIVAFVAVAAGAHAAAQVANQYKLDSAPTLVIDGHYTTSPAQAGHDLASTQAAHAALFAVMDSLVAKSAQERATKK
ncbi:MULTISPECIES: hypothetical protein [unclassified Duganella]|uniref:hypothetical protein n=1 Tax=unclassified Duganella TaxID=2636909 RepID=UPI001E41913C|nr:MULTISPECIES: hypothetical protein [unclassified Duganella]